MFPISPASSGQSFLSSRYAFRTVSPFSEDLGEFWIIAMPHPDLRVRASDIKSHENPGIQSWGTPNSRAGRTWLCSMLGSKWLYLRGMRFWSVRAKPPAWIFVQEKPVKIGQFERCVEVFSIRSTVHDIMYMTVFFTPQIPRCSVLELTTIHVFLDVDNQATFKRCLKLSFKITKQLTITIPGPRKEGVIFLIPPKKMVGTFTPKKTPQNSDEILPLQECCMPKPASPSGGLECFDALFTRDPFWKDDIWYLVSWELANRVAREKNNKASQIQRCPSKVPTLKELKVFEEKQNFRIGATTYATLSVSINIFANLLLMSIIWSNWYPEQTSWWVPSCRKVGCPYHTRLRNDTLVFHAGCLSSLAKNNPTEGITLVIFFALSLHTPPKNCSWMSVGWCHGTFTQQQKSIVKGMNPEPATESSDFLSC